MCLCWRGKYTEACSNLFDIVSKAAWLRRREKQTSRGFHDRTPSEQVRPKGSLIFGQGRKHSCFLEMGLSNGGKIANAPNHTQKWDSQICNLKAFVNVQKFTKSPLGGNPALRCVWDIVRKVETCWKVESTLRTSYLPVITHQHLELWEPYRSTEETPFNQHNHSQIVQSIPCGQTSPNTLHGCWGLLATETINVAWVQFDSRGHLKRWHWSSGGVYTNESDIWPLNRRILRVFACLVVFPSASVSSGGFTPESKKDQMPWIPLAENNAAAVSVFFPGVKQTFCQATSPILSMWSLFAQMWKSTNSQRARTHLEPLLCVGVIPDARWQQQALSFKPKHKDEETTRICHYHTSMSMLHDE